jgi:O-antigen ligase
MRDRWVRDAHLGRVLNRVDFLFYLSAFVLVASLFLGGATHGGFLSDTLLQFTAIPLLLVALWRLFETPLPKEVWLPLGFCAALALLPLLQLVPLPPLLWTALPNRGPSEAAFTLSGQPTPWMPISVTPQETWLSFLALIAPIAIFLATLLLPYRDRRWLTLVVLAVGALSVIVGLIQVAQGPNSPLRFFEITNPTEAVGFFANRNHFAAFLYVLLLLAAAWAVHAAMSVGNLRTSEFQAGSLIAVVAGFTLLVVLLAGEAMARSRAGLALTIVALFGAFALGFTDRRLRSGITPNKVLLAAVALAVIFAVQYALYRILERFDVDLTQDARLDFGKHTIEAAKAYMPIGSGLGSFVPVYALFETPEDTLANTFANHAHNDILEFWLEAGIFSLALMACFAIWFVFRAVQIWQSILPRAGALDLSLARAATLIVTLVVAHSFVDYPLRTGAMTAMLAFACGLMINPLVTVEELPAPRVERRPQRRKKLGPPPQMPAEPLPTPALPAAKWGSNVKWPEEWTKASRAANKTSTGSSEPSDNTS